jgi:hypothetical protein
MPPLDTAIAILDPDDVLLELGLSEAEFSRVERLVNAASARLERYCNTIFRAREVTRVLSGSPHPLLDLGAPIVSVSSVTIDGQPLVSSDYRVLAARGELYRDGGWATYSALSGGVGVNNVTVVATLGYEPIPHDVQEACLLLVRYWREQAGRLGLASERVAEYAYERLPARGDLPDEVRALVEPYRRW